jgi:peptide/nickel transport system substrate-binding protein
MTSGIVTNDATGTITFHLIAPDPDFVGKLAVIEWAAAVPPGTPLRTIATRPIPGTGPYMIGRFEPDRLSSGRVVHHGSITLVRNPSFHQWSVAAQPAGYPDLIRSIYEPTTGAALGAVEHGRADIAFPDPDDVPALARKYPAQVRTSGPAFTDFVVLNAAIPPFNNPMARRAVGHALIGDPVIHRLFGDPPACFLVPANLPGYSPGCPYRRDLALAKRQVTVSGTRGSRVNVYFASDGPFAPYGRRVARVLRQIGYDAHLTLQPGSIYDPTLYNARTRPVNVEGDAWFPDFLAASQYYLPLLSCHTVGTLTFGSCNRHIDALASKASGLQGSDPGAAQRAWQTVYRQVAADARLIPTTARSGIRTFVSTRVGNYQPMTYAPGYPDLDQLWVR